MMDLFRINKSAPGRFDIIRKADNELVATVEGQMAALLALAAVEGYEDDDFVYNGWYDRMMKKGK